MKLLLWEFYSDFPYAATSYANLSFSGKGSNTKRKTDKHSEIIIMI